MFKTKLAASAALMSMLSTVPTLAASDEDVGALRAELQEMRQSYESRIENLENKLAQMESEKASEPEPPAVPVAVAAPSSANSFNPAIGLILNGRYSSFSEGNSTIQGFGTPGEGARSAEGLKLGESELNLSANVDDKFRGSVTLSFANENGTDSIGIEEAYIETLPGMGLPTGMSIKAGRALWILGYLNEQHTHVDDFVDRPLPYRVFLNGAYNDDGVQVSYVLPTDLYTEIGGGIFRGDDYPFGSATGSGLGAWSAYARVGGDIGDDQTWRVGGYILSGDTPSRASNAGTVKFTGDTTLYTGDLRYTWAPTGNPYEQEILFQGEYFWRNENGTYEDTNAATGPVAFNENATGWYTQGVYKFTPQWRVGYRYSQMQAPDTPAGLTGSLLDSSGHDPDAHAVMMDWSNSEFSRIRFQYNRENLASGVTDNQFLLQYIMSLGAHGAHNY